MHNKRISLYTRKKNTHESQHFNRRRPDVHRMHGVRVRRRRRPAQIDQRQHAQRPGDEQFAQIQPTPRHVAVHRGAHVEDVEDGQRPEEGARRPDQYGVLEAAREERILAVPGEGGVLCMVCAASDENSSVGMPVITNIACKVQSVFFYVIKSLANS